MSFQSSFYLALTEIDAKIFLAFPTFRIVLAVVVAVLVAAAG
jgi:hypothetical protein